MEEKKKTKKDQKQKGQVVKTLVESVFKPLNATIEHSTYANSFVVMEKNDELVLMFGQAPPLADETVLTTRIYIKKSLIKSIIQMLNDIENKDKKDQKTEETIEYQ